MSTLLPSLERDLVRAARRTHPAATPATRRSSRGGHRGLVPLVVAFVLLALTAAALAATGVISIGSAVPTSHQRPNPHRDAGAVVPGTTKVLSLRASDPDGGPDWAMRIQATTRGTRCIQAARVVNGRLGVIGQNGVFNDDGRFHPLGPMSGSLACQTVDAQGNTVFSVSMSAVPASGGLGGLVGIDVGGCSGKPCPPGDLRGVYYGFVGPDAESITYDGDDGAQHVMRPLAPYGAYLIVRRVTDTSDTGFSVGPDPGPVVRKVTFRDGRSCTFPRAAPGARYEPCAPFDRQPSAPKYTHAQLAAPIRAHPYLHRVRRGAYWSISVSFRARAAITTAGQSYVILLHNPRAKDGISLIGFTRSDIAAGAVVTKRATYQPPSGVHTGEVRLVTTTAPGPFIYQAGKGSLVGRFKVRIP